MSPVTGQPPDWRVVSPSHGIGWVLQALVLMRSQLARLLLLSLVLQFVLGLTQMPLLGLLVIIAMPALSAGMLQGFHDTAQGRKPMPTVLFAALAAKPRTGRLLGLGALLFGVGLLSMSVVMSGSQGMLDPDLVARIEKGDMDAIAALDPELIRRFVIAMVLGLSISGTLSFMTVPLIWFTGQTTGSAVLIGLKALLLNWKPFLLLSLGLVVLVVPTALLVGALFQSVGASRVLSFVLLALIVFIGLAFQLVLFGTQYCAFRDIFAMPEAPVDDTPPVTPDNDQFVA